VTEKKSGGRRLQSQRDESEADRLDRNYLEMLQELRVLQAGMQILFAFLLSLAFASRFDETTPFQRDLYIVTLVCAALATACLIAPVPFHRIVFRRGMKDDLIVAANRYVAAGLCFLFLSMAGAILLVLDFLIDITVAVTVTGALAVAFVVLWVVIPFRSRATESDDTQDEPGGG
jgi:O-antigen/teichoic acid export membrane protein